MKDEADSVMVEALPIVTSLRKFKITRRNVTVDNVLAMVAETDQSWRDLHGSHERLRWARQRWQRAAGAVNGTASDAAKSLGVKPGTYRSYERPPSASKHTPLDHQTAIQFGRRFKVYWAWLLAADGTPFDDQHTPMERLVKAASDLPDDAQKALAAMAEALQTAQRTGTKG